METLRLLIVDDSRAQRIILTRILADLADAEIVGEAADGPEAVEKYKELNPDVVLLDLVMPKAGGETALGSIRAYDPDAQVVILSSMGTSSAVQRCLELGARSFLQKPYDVEDLYRTLESLRRKSRWVT